MACPGNLDADNHFGKKYSRPGSRRISMKYHPEVAAIMNMEDI